MSTLVKKYPAISLLILALLVSLALFAPVAAGIVPAGFAQLAALGPSIAGIILAAIEGRKGGVRELLGRFLIWRVGIGWWLFALFFPIIPVVGALYLYNLFGGPAVDLTGLAPLYTVVPMILMLTIAAGMGEEFGWRGYAMPRLQARYNALVASIIVGVIHGIWHIPLFLVEGTTQYSWRSDVGLVVAVLMYTVFVTAWAIQYTWVFNNTKGSVLLVAVVHGAGNAWIGGYIDVYRGHIGGIYAFTALTIVVSIVIVLVAGPANLSRKYERNVLQLEEA